MHACRGWGSPCEAIPSHPKYEAWCSAQTLSCRCANGATLCHSPLRQAAAESRCNDNQSLSSDANSSRTQTCLSLLKQIAKFPHSRSAKGSYQRTIRLNSPQTMQRYRSNHCRDREPQVPRHTLARDAHQVSWFPCPRQVIQIGQIVQNRDATVRQSVTITLAGFHGLIPMMQTSGAPKHPNNAGKWTQEFYYRKAENNAH